MAAITVAAVCEGKVQAAVGRRRGRRVQIRQLGEAQLPEGCLTGSLQVDPAALQSALADFWQDQRLPVRRVALLLGGRPFVCRRLCLPHMRPGRLRGVLRHEMDTAGEIADPLDDYMLLDRDLRRGTDTVLATRVERGVIGDWAELARALGLGLVSIDLAAAGLIRLVRALPEHRQRTFLVLVPEGGFLSAFLFDPGARRAVRTRSCSGCRGSSSFIRPKKVPTRSPTSISAAGPTGSWPPVPRARRRWGCRRSGFPTARWYSCRRAGRWPIACTPQGR